MASVPPAQAPSSRSKDLSPGAASTSPAQLKQSPASSTLPHARPSILMASVPRSPKNSLKHTVVKPPSTSLTSSRLLADLLLDPAQLETGTSKPRRLGEKKATSLSIRSMTPSRAPLARWIFAMGIPQIGESAAREIARLHRDLAEVARQHSRTSFKSTTGNQQKRISPRNKSNPPAH